MDDWTCHPDENNYSHNMACIILKDWIDIAQGLSVIVASIVAIYGINSWRDELLGKRRMELAEEVLALFYQAKDVIGWVRFPASLSDESSGRKSETAETNKQKQIRDAAYVVSKRYNEHSEMFSRIRALRYRFMAQFGKDASIPFDDLKSILDDIFGALDMWVMLSPVDTSEHDPQQLQAHQARIQERKNIVWGLGENDFITPRIENVINHIEQTCRPHIGSKSKI